MSLAPINPSDLIPITGAYQHRIVLPAIAGYEGVGRVIAAPKHHSHLIGKRVLPLRGQGTWQTVVDCDPMLAVLVPEAVADDVAARAYINPLAALLMLERWPVRGKRVLLSGVGSSCADYLGHWARSGGAKEVIGLYRSESRVARLRSLGIDPVSINDKTRVSSVAAEADLVFDALGGPVASDILQRMPAGSTFVGYGLLTGEAIRLTHQPGVEYRRFHLRDSLADMPAGVWQERFSALWPLLNLFELSEFQIFELESWKTAIIEAGRPGGKKPLLRFSHHPP